jgi:serine/threonine protein kinase
MGISTGESNLGREQQGHRIVVGTGHPNTDKEASRNKGTLESILDTREVISEGPQGIIERVTIAELSGKSFILKMHNYPDGKGVSVEEATELHRKLTRLIGAASDGNTIYHSSDDHRYDAEILAQRSLIDIPFIDICRLKNPYALIRELSGEIAPEDLRLQSLLIEMATYAHTYRKFGKLAEVHFPRIFGIKFIPDQAKRGFFPAIVMEDLGESYQQTGVWADGLSPVNDEGVLQIAARQLGYYHLANSLRKAYLMLHQNGVWHLDYKPANLLIRSGEGSPYLQEGLKILDFGTAALTGELEPEYTSASLNTAPPETAWLYAMGYHISQIYEYYCSPESADLQMLERSNAKIEVFQIAMMFWQLVFDDYDPAKGITKHPRSSLIVPGKDHASAESFSINPKQFFAAENYKLVNDDGSVVVGLQQILKKATERTGLIRSDLLDLLKVIQKGAAFSPADRYETAAELLIELESVFSQFPRALGIEV